MNNNYVEWAILLCLGLWLPIIAMHLREIVKILKRNEDED